MNLLNRELSFQPIIADKERIIALCCRFGLGLCFSQARLFGDVSPFSTAAVAAMGGSRFAVAAGACIGYLLRLDGAWGARHIASVIAAAAIGFSAKQRPYSAFACVNAGVCMVLTGLTVLLAQGFNLNGLMLYFCESAISAAMALFLQKTYTAADFFIKREPLPQGRLTALAICLCALLVSMQSFELYGISPARAAAVFFVLCAAKFLGSAGGGVCGGAMGFALSIGGRLTFLGSGFAFGGLVSGLLSSVGRIAQAGAFAVCIGTTVLMNTGQENLMPPLYETALGAAAFVLVPAKLFDTAAVYFTGRQKLPEYEMMKLKLKMRFKGIEKGLEEVAEALEEIAKSLVKMDSGDEPGRQSEVKHLVRDQFSTLAMAVEDVSRELNGETRFDTAAAARVSGVLTGYGIKPNSVVCSCTDGIERVEISAQKIKGKFSRAALMQEMEAACGCKLNSPTIREEREETMLTFVQKPQLNLRIGKAQFTANESGLCGDSCDLFLDKDGNQIIVISDGMGTGPRAAVDGAVAAWLFSKLIAAGLNFDSSLRLSNSALIVKSEEETLATIDAAKINLHTGEIDFFKAGAGSSLVCKGRKVYSYGSPSMPLGILREIEFSKDKACLSRGDVLLMMSDGVGTATYSLIGEELRSFNKKDPSALAERVVEIARRSSGGGHIDDITVIAVVVG